MLSSPEVTIGRLPEQGRQEAVMRLIALTFSKVYVHWRNIVSSSWKAKEKHTHHMVWKSPRLQVIPAPYYYFSWSCAAIRRSALQPFFVES